MKLKFTRYQIYQFISLSAFCLLVLFGSNVFAAVGGGNDSGQEGAGCSDGKSNAIVDLCDGGKKGGGASWRLYEAKNNTISISSYSSHGTTISSGGIIKGCKDDGGWYLRYAYEGIIQNGVTVRYKNQQVPGILSITGNAGTHKFYSNKMFKGGVRPLFAKTPTMQFNEADAVEILNPDGTIKKDILNGIGDNGVKVKWDDVKKLFDAMEKNKSGSTEGYTMAPGAKGKGGGTGLGWFCFNPKVLDDNIFYSKSGASAQGQKSGGASSWSKLDKEAASLKLQIGDANIAVKFEHAILIDSNDKKPSEFEFKNDYTIERKGKDDDKFGGTVDRSSSWERADEDSKKTGNKMWKTMIKGGELTIKKDDVPDGGSLKICEEITYAKKKFKIESGKITYEDNAKLEGSKVCVEITKDKPAPADDFCSKVVDQTDNFGNNAVWSYVRNANKPDGGAWPDLNGGIAVPTDNNSPKSGLKMTSIIGGTGAIKGGDNPAVSVFAKPSDNIQFRHVVCYGAQAVKALGLKEAQKGDEDRGYNKDGKDASVFNLEAKIGNSTNSDSNTSGNSSENHLFGLSGSMSFKSHSDSKPEFSEPTGFNGDAKAKFGAVLDAPSGGNYDCKHNNGKDYINPLYQVPGILSGHSDSRSCSSIFSSGNISNKDLAGRALQHQLNSDGHQAWIGGKGERTYAWDKSGYRPDVFDPPFMDVEPTSCGCNVKGDFNLEKSMTYKEDDASGGIQYGECTSDGKCSCRCAKKPGPLKPGESEYYHPDCENSKTKGKIEFNKTKDDISKKVTFYPLSQNKDGKTDKVSTNVLVPYNFNTKMESAPTFTGSGAHEEGGVVFAGEVVTPESELKVLPRKNPVVSEETIDSDSDTAYATRTPEMKTKIIAFTISPDVDLSGAGLPTGNRIVDGTENQITGDIGVSSATTITVIDASSAAYNQSGNLKGTTGDEPEKVNLGSITVPDVAVGTKLCVIAAVYPADSHGLPRQEDVPDGNDQIAAMGDQVMNNKSWRLSPPACRTIAKKPSTQVWNGGVISGGSITGAPAHKIDSVLGKNTVEKYGSEAIRHFGSWSEYELIAKDKISGFGSGAAMGYDISTSTPRFALPGGIYNPAGPFACAISKLTIANSPADKACDDSTSTAMGESGITIDATIRERLEGRYRNLATKASGDVELKQAYSCKYGSSGYEPDKVEASVGLAPICANNGVRYIGGKNINVVGPGSGGAITLGATSDTSSNKNTNNTMVIDAENNVRIKSNIYYEKTDYKNIASIPQLLIFANNIYIDANVKNIDAWLIADNIYTCAQAHKKDSDEIDPSIEAATEEGSAGGNSICGKQLTINGPVFAGNLSLLRHAGAYPGGGSRMSGFNSKNPVPDLLSDGSITPAEIFNLRPDAYLWAYAQAERLTQAFVTYSRELPPRY